MNDKPITTLEQKKDRRGLLALIGAGGAAALAALFNRSNGAHAGHPTSDPTIFHLGVDNTAPAGSTTSVEGNVEGSAIAVNNSFTGENASAIHATTVGLFGVAVRGDSGSGFGVIGTSQDGAGGSFQCQNGVGLEGFSQNAVGVSGSSASSRAGLFVSQSDAGLLAVSPGDAPAVQAVSGLFLQAPVDPPSPDGGLALDVVGKARFSTAGGGTVPHGHNSVFVPNSAVTPDSHITVTLASNPGPRVLRWVDRSPGSGFTVHLTPARPSRRPETDFTYLIVEPA